MSEASATPSTPANPVTIESILFSAIGRTVNKWVFYSVVAICITIIAILAAIVAVAVSIVSAEASHSGLIERLSTDGLRIFHPNSVELFFGSSFKFWTPSEDTYDYLKNETPNLTEKELEWYMVAGGEKLSGEARREFWTQKLKELGDDLRLAGVTSYSRYPVWGVGGHGYKPGWMWEVTVPKAELGNFDRNFQALYKRYFHRDDNIYLEENRLQSKNRR